MDDILVGRGVRRRPPTLFDLISGPAQTTQSALGAMGSAGKGAAQATVGLPGDIESLVRMITGGEQRLPTTEKVGEFVNQYIRAPYPQYERLGEFTGLPTAGALTRPATQLTNEATDALVRMITGNPQATAQRVIQETSMPFIQAAAPRAPGLLDTSYRGMHSAPSREFGAPLFELNKIYPDDIYSLNAARLYGHGGDDVAMDKRTAQIVRSFRGKPDAEITIYRAVPKDETIKDINAGDWVTINKDYAKQHGESILQGKYKILERKVKVKDVWTNADSIHEYGYDPEIVKMSPKEKAKAAWEANPDNKELYEAYRKLRLSE